MSRQQIIKKAAELASSRKSSSSSSSKINQLVVVSSSSSTVSAAAAAATIIIVKTSNSPINQNKRPHLSATACYYTSLRTNFHINQTTKTARITTAAATAVAAFVLIALASPTLAIAREQRHSQTAVAADSLYDLKFQSSYYPRDDELLHDDEANDIEQEIQRDDISTTTTTTTIYRLASRQYKVGFIIDIPPI